VAHRPLLAAPVLLIIVAAGALAPPTARAADPVLVTTTDDEANVDGDCSLREAVLAVNAQAPVDACQGASDSHTIVLEGGATYELSVAGAGEDAGLTGDLDLARPMTIEAARGADPRATIDARGLDRIFDVLPTTELRLTRFWSLHLRNGDAGGSDGGVIRFADATCDGSPGSRRDISLFNVVIENGRAARGGGLHVGGCHLASVTLTSIVHSAATDVGGAVSVEGDSILGIETSTISHNAAGAAGGGIHAALTGGGFGLELATVAENRAPDGGGIWSTTSVQLLMPVLARNDGGNCGGPGGTYVGGVSDDDTCGSTGVSDIGLLPLTSFDGTPVHPLAPMSSAIDTAGEPPANGWCSSNLFTDQVGADRPLDGDGDGVAACDAGAIEAPAVPFVGAQPPPAPLPDTAASIQAVATSPSDIVGVAALAGLGAMLGWRLVRRLARPC
jgi:CSLREA domain-containing protein